VEKGYCFLGDTYKYVFKYLINTKMKSSILKIEKLAIQNDCFVLCKELRKDFDATK